MHSDWPAGSGGPNRNWLPLPYRIILPHANNYSYIVILKNVFKYTYGKNMREESPTSETPPQPTWKILTLLIFAYLSFRDDKINVDINLYFHSFKDDYA